MTSLHTVSCDMHSTYSWQVVFGCCSGFGIYGTGSIAATNGKCCVLL